MMVRILQALGAFLLLLLPACSNDSTSSLSSPSSSLVQEDVAAPSEGYASFSTLSGLEPGTELRLRLNRRGTQVDEYTVAFDSVYDSGERLVLLSTAEDLIIGAGDSGSPVLDAEGRVVAALCYGWADNKHFFAARAIEDLLTLPQRPQAARQSLRQERTSAAGAGFQPLGMAGSSMTLRETLSTLAAQERALPYRTLAALLPPRRPSSERNPNAVLQPLLQPGNTVAVLDLSGDLGRLGAYGTLSYSSGGLWLAFAHAFTQSGGQLKKPVIPATMVSMIDASPNAQKLPQAISGSLGALTGDYFSGIVIDPTATASTVEVVTQVTLDNQTETFTHQVSHDVNLSYQRLLLAYAASAPADYLMDGVIRGGSATGTLTWSFDNASTDNTSLTVSSSDLASQLFSDVDTALPQDDSVSLYRALRQVELTLSLTLE